MSRGERAVRENGQAANSSWSMEIFHTVEVMLVYNWGLAHGQKLFCEFSESGEFCNICEIVEFCDCCSATGYAVGH